MASLARAACETSSGQRSGFGGGPLLGRTGITEVRPFDAATGIQPQHSDSGNQDQNWIKQRAPQICKQAEAVRKEIEPDDCEQDVLASPGEQWSDRNKQERQRRPVTEVEGIEWPKPERRSIERHCKRHEQGSGGPPRDECRVWREKSQQ